MHQLRGGKHHDQLWRSVPLEHGRGWMRGLLVRGLVAGFDDGLRRLPAGVCDAAERRFSQLGRRGRVCSLRGRAIQFVRSRRLPKLRRWIDDS